MTSCTPAGTFDLLGALSPKGIAVNFLIPIDRIGQFSSEYGTWCILAKRTFSLIYTTSVTVHVAHNPNATTNTSNPIPNSERVRMDDSNGTFADFAEAYTHWKQFSYSRA
jgi:hypothetical protein